MVNNYLSRKACTCLKGWLALAILIHHIYQFSGILSGTPFSFVFINLGYWAVGLFMFLSGFGLYESYKLKGQAYIKLFPRNRLLTFEISYLIFVLIYSVYDFAMGIGHTLKDYCLTLTYGSTVISFGWYLQLSMAMYLIFWVVFRFIQGSNRQLWVLAALLCVFIIINIYVGIDEGRYTPVVYFAVGIMWSAHKEKADIILFKFRYLLFIIMCIIFLGGYVILWRYNLPVYAVAMVRALSGIAGIIAIESLLYTCYRFNGKMGQMLLGIFENPAMKFLSKISLEVYALQGIVLRTLYPQISNQYLFALAGFVSAILVAIPVQKLLSILKNSLRTRGVQSNG